MLRFILFLIVTAGGLTVATASAQEGDSAAGKALFAVQCVSCHGVNGASVIPANPILSGQHADYLNSSLKAYRGGSRKNAVMGALAQALTDEQINDISAYLAQQQPVIAGSSDLDLAKQSERLYRGGSIERGLPACSACHGPTGAGIAALAPRLSGQYPGYTAAALKAYISGERENIQMNSIAGKLSEEEILGLAEFISGLAY